MLSKKVKNITFFVDFEKGLLIFPQNCLAATATEAGAAQSVSVTVIAINNSVPCNWGGRSTSWAAPVPVAVAAENLAST